MAHRSRFAMFALLALTPLSAQAETPPVAGATRAGTDLPDPERLALAQQVIAIVLPPDQAELTVTRMMDAITAPMIASAGAKFDSDPGLKTIWASFIDQVTATARETMRSLIPRMRVAYSVAYARHFTRDELTQLLAFGKTPTGAKYLSRASELMQDSSIKALMVQSMNQTTDKMQPAIESFKVRIKAYLAAHPEVAKSLAQ
ncbi:DUF2059 domain-containing protein [Novosphingobium sp.]|uniref:DUF2059 domain-containing protein n=1 Tax=Novosphingobium sp. TaxID=1874826 RepID=UPI003D1288A4